MSKHSTSQRDINARERMNLALGLRKGGATLDQIAAKCGYASRSSAHKAIKRAMAELPRENAEEVRALEVARLDDLLLAWWERAKKDSQAAYLVLKIGERRSRLLGLDIDPEQAKPVQTIVRLIPQGYLDGPLSNGTSPVEAYAQS